ncbi:MAG TPA: hypothetical protein VH115_07170 [Solirubrobacteraceae bacterium]|nr:hypothetical protein [Solirubrobacteraceae bacterium]
MQPASETSARCAGTAAGTLARAAGQVAERIYLQELKGPGVHNDQRQVEGYLPLLRAVASENRAAMRAAVTRLIYSRTHIVRLRVSSPRGAIVDVGGPYIIAPAGGTLRLHRRTVGRYLLSVQDDLGYVKLETRFLGIPVALFSGNHALPIEGTAPVVSANEPQLAPVNYRGASAEAFSFTARAFPSGSLRVTLLVPPQRVSGATVCDAARAIELGLIAERIWSRYALASARPAVIVRAIARLTGALTFARGGSAQLAGSAWPWPSALPAGGTLRYRGHTYHVTSFTARAGRRAIRVYLLV